MGHICGIQREHYYDMHIPRAGSPNESQRYHHRWVIFVASSANITMICIFLAQGPQMNPNGIIINWSYLGHPARTLPLYPYLSRRVPQMSPNGIVINWSYLFSCKQRHPARTQPLYPYIPRAGFPKCVQTVSSSMGHICLVASNGIQREHNHYIHISLAQGPKTGINLVANTRNWSYLFSCKQRHPTHDNHEHEHEYDHNTYIISNPINKKIEIKTY